MVESYPQWGGGVSSKQVKLGDPYGDLPIPSKPGYSFNGWYEEALVTSESVLTTPCDKTLVAEWNDGIKIDMREWGIVPPSYSINLEDAFINWNVYNGKNEIDFRGVGGFEVKYTTLNLRKNKTYSVVFDYVLPNFTFTTSAGNIVDKMYSYITSINPATNSLYLMTDRVESVVSIYALNSNTSGRAVLSLTAREDATYYFIINFGYLNDDITYHFEFNNFTLYTHQCSFG